MSKVGVGLSKIWQLPQDHPFYPAAKYHDASFDAVYILQGKKKIEDIKGPLYPSDYSVIIKQKLDQLDWMRLSIQDENKLIKEFIRRSDMLFEARCNSLATSRWLKLQAAIFCKLVKTYSFIKFRL